MAKRKRKEADIVLETSEFTLSDLIEHYAEMKFRFWDGSAHMTKEPYHVYENLPGGKKTSKRFNDESLALKYIGDAQGALIAALKEAFKLNEPETS